MKEENLMSERIEKGNEDLEDKCYFRIIAGNLNHESCKRCNGYRFECPEYYPARVSMAGNK